MHRFHQSRGRIFFEVLCALAVSLSCVGTWLQTGASAILPAAAVALLYGFVRAFDMVGRRSATADLGQIVATKPPEPVAAAEQSAPAASEARSPKAPRKPRTRRPAAKAGAKVAELVLTEEAKVVEPAPAEEMTVVDLVSDEEPAPMVPMPPDEMAHPSLAPLFEPEPFVRQQRTVFGRKSG